jgi:peptide deformylase
MAVLPILKYPDPFLRRASEKVAVFDESLASLAEDMRETMIAARGVGLAAPQIGRLLRLVVIGGEAMDEPPLILVNPEIAEFRGEQLFEEGCLSVEELKADVTRARSISLKAVDLEGRPLEFEFEVYRAVVAQHEIDHLDGVLFIDYLSNLKRKMYGRKMAKRFKKSQEEK